MTADLAYEGLLKNAYPGGIRDRAGYEHNDNPYRRRNDVITPKEAMCPKA